MNKIFKQGSLVQSVACSEITTSKAGRVVATTLALAIVSSFATQAQAQAQPTNATNHTVDFTIKDPNDPRLYDKRKDVYLKGTLGKITGQLVDGMLEAKTEFNNKIKIVQDNLAAEAKFLKKSKADNEKAINQIGTRVGTLEKYLVENFVPEFNAHDGRLDKNEANIAQNSKDIEETVKYINAVNDAVDKNEAAITQNEGKIAANTTSIQAKADIETVYSLNNNTNKTIADNKAELKAEIDANKAAIDSKVDQDSFNHVHGEVNNNTNAIAINAGNISNNTADIAANTGKIAANEGKIAANTTSIQANTGKIAANEGKIAANTTSIQANTGKIAANEG
ncbi:hypothetical protein, partial [Moraxella sp. 7664LN]|uniref:hypothetical protein n=3 Tax=Moraxella TaxID=475 RepID=UPI003A5CFA3A